MRTSDVQESAPVQEGLRLTTQSGHAARWVAALTWAEVISLVVASALHLSGQVTGRSAPFDAQDAGIAEALTAVVLAGAAISLWSRAARARTKGLVGIGFAIASFGVGLAVTTRSGHWPDIAYHLTVLPLLIASFIAVLRLPRTAAK